MQTEHTQKLGGPWSLPKVGAVEEYLRAHATVVSKPSFDLTYIDVFAGSGSFTFGEGLTLIPASLLVEEDRKALVDGTDACLMGGREFAQVSLAFVPPSNGNDPNAALAFAACCLARRGGMPASSAEAA
jgi:hypothetical protein